MVKERILVAGGAIGGYMAAYLAKAGADVVLLDAWPDNVSEIQRSGMRVEGLTAGENFTTPIRTIHIGDVAALCAEPTFDWIFMAVKSYDTTWMTTLVKPLLAPHGCVVSFQNGIQALSLAWCVSTSRHRIVSLFDFR